MERKFEGNNHAQVFLHYNNINGPYKDYCKYDAQSYLPVEFRSEEKKRLLAKVDIQLNEQRNNRTKT